MARQAADGSGTILHTEVYSEVYSKASPEFIRDFVAEAYETRESAALFERLKDLQRILRPQLQRRGSRRG